MITLATWQTEKTELSGNSGETCRGKMCTCKCKRFTLQRVSRAGVPINKWAPRGDRDEEKNWQREIETEKMNGVQGGLQTGNKMRLYGAFALIRVFSGGCAPDEITYCTLYCHAVINTHTHTWGSSTLLPPSRLTCYHTVQPTTCMGGLNTTYIPAGLHTRTHSKEASVTSSRTWLPP